MPIIYRHWFPCTITPENPHGKGYTGYTYRTVEERDKARFSDKKDSVGLKRAIVKYGKENMQTDIIESDIPPNHELVIEREKYWIAYFDDYHNGCNWTEGGDGVRLFGKDNPRFGIGAGSGENHPMFGRKHTPETIAKMSGENNHRFGIGAGSGENHPMFGRKHTPETIAKFSGENNGMFGRKHTPETIAKMSEKSKGENNRMFGRTGEKSPRYGITGENHPNTRPEYTQARCFFFLEIAPMEAGIKEKRKRFREAFPDVPQQTRSRWFRTGQEEISE